MEHHFLRSTSESTTTENTTSESTACAILLFILNVSGIARKHQKVGQFCKKGSSINALQKNSKSFFSRTSINNCLLSLQHCLEQVNISILPWLNETAWAVL